MSMIYRVDVQTTENAFCVLEDMQFHLPTKELSLELHARFLTEAYKFMTEHKLRLKVYEKNMELAR